MLTVSSGILFFLKFVVSKLVRHLSSLLSFKYLGHYVANDFSDDNNILPEICMFFRTNILICRFSK